MPSTALLLGLLILYTIISGRMTALVDNLTVISKKFLDPGLLDKTKSKSEDSDTWKDGQEDDEDTGNRERTGR